MKRHYCDACEVEITAVNRPDKEPILVAKSLDTENEFSFRISWGLTAPDHVRITQGPGDICKVCLVNLLGEAIDRERDKIDTELADAADAEAEEFDAQFESILGGEDEDEENEDENQGDDIDPETGEVEEESEEDEDDLPAPG